MQWHNNFITTRNNGVVTPSIHEYSSLSDVIRIEKWRWMKILVAYCGCVHIWITDRAKYYPMSVFYCYISFIPSTIRIAYGLRYMDSWCVCWDHSKYVNCSLCESVWRLLWVKCIGISYVTIHISVDFYSPAMGTAEEHIITMNAFCFWIVDSDIMYLTYSIWIYVYHIPWHILIWWKFPNWENWWMNKNPFFYNWQLNMPSTESMLPNVCFWINFTDFVFIVLAIFQ